MDKLEEHLKKVVTERSIFSSIDSYERSVQDCVVRCKTRIRNGPNAQQQVNLCISQCKVQKLQKILAALITMATKVGAKEN